MRPVGGVPMLCVGFAGHIELIAGMRVHAAQMKSSSKVRRAPPEAGRKYSSSGTGRFHSMMKTELVATACTVNAHEHGGSQMTTLHICNAENVVAMPPVLSASSSDVMQQ